MLTLENLFHFDVPWGINRFPDGQNQIWFDVKDVPDTLTSRGSLKVIRGECSLATPESVDILNQLAYISAQIGIQLSVHYMYGARCDKYEAGTREVPNVALAISNMLEMLDAYMVLDPHCIDYVTSTNTRYHMHSKVNVLDYAALIFADESAWIRWNNEPGRHWSSPTNFSGVFPQSTVAIVCEKERDQETGRITSYKVPNVPKGKCLVIDDICDGGSTFMLLGDAIPNELDLQVTHGIFSNNADTKLLKRYGKIFTTNSYPQDGRVLEGNVIIDNVWTIPGA